MHGNAFPVKVRQLLKQVPFLHQHRAPQHRGKAVLIIGCGDAKGRGQSLVLPGQGLPPCLNDVRVGGGAAVINNPDKAVASR